MASKFLTVYHDNAIQTLTGLLPTINNSLTDLKELQYISQQYRFKGICSLLMNMDLETLRRDLFKCDRSFMHGLQKLPQEQRTASKLLPFFDAISCHDFEGATKISQLARKDVYTDIEYEEDFLYINFLMNYFFLHAEQSFLEAILEKYEQLSPDDPRFSVCQSFYLKNKDTFHLSIERLVDQFDKKNRLLLEKGAISEEEYETEGQLFIEGWALIILGNKLGFNNHNNYRYIPSILHQMSDSPLQNVNWEKRLF